MQKGLKMIVFDMDGVLVDIESSWEFVHKAFKVDGNENLEKYLQKLASSFNPCAIEGLMCRTLVSVSWDGYMYDCDFNQAAGLHLGGKKTHISELRELVEPGEPIAVSYHCYTCTAGAGFT